MPLVLLRVRAHAFICYYVFAVYTLVFVQIYTIDADQQFTSITMFENLAY